VCLAQGFWHRNDRAIPVGKRNRLPDGREGTMTEEFIVDIDGRRDRGRSGQFDFRRDDGKPGPPIGFGVTYGPVCSANVPGTPDPIGFGDL
jgi:hypothetical protein